jgi:hypothetical protein
MILFPAPPPETLAKLLDGLDAIAKQRDAIGVLALRFPESLHLVYAHAANRAVTVGRLLFAGGEPLGFVGLRVVREAADPFYCFLPEMAARPETREQLRTLSHRLHPGVQPPCVLLAEVPQPHPRWRESAEALFGTACRAASGLEQPCRLIFATGTDPACVPLQGSGILDVITEHLRAEHCPVGVLGIRRTPDGTGTEVGQPLARYGDAAWVPRYLAAVQTVTLRLRWLGGPELRPVLGEGTLAGLNASMLLRRLDAADRTLRDAILVVVLDDGASIAARDGRAAHLAELLAAGGTPTGILGWSQVSGVLEIQCFTELADEPWATHYLTRVAEVLTDRGTVCVAA